VNLASLLDRWAAEAPGRLAIIDAARGRDRRLTFGELAIQSRQTAALFQASGLRRGDRILVFQPMAAELYVHLLGMWRLGLVAVFADPAAGRDHLEQCCEIASPDALLAVGKAHWLRIKVPSLRRIPRKFAIGFSPFPVTAMRTAAGLSPLERLEELPGEHPALITFTSGSTGRPKAALRTHRFLLSQHRVLERSIALEPGEIDLATLPIFALANLASGLTTLIPDCDLRRPGFIEPQPVISQIKRIKPHRSTASPAFFLRLAEACERSGETLPCFRKIFTGGAPVFPRTLTAIQSMTPAARVEALYGSTEAEPIAHISSGEIPAEDLSAMEQGRGLLAGEPVKEIRLRIVRADELPQGEMGETEFSRLHQPPGETGEILVAGDHVLNGYVGGHGDQETKLRVGATIWHRTGDAGYLDEKGRLWLLGRWSARIVREGKVLFPFAVECAAGSHPAVESAALSTRRGKTVLAIELRRGGKVPTLDELNLATAGIDEIHPVKKMPLDKRHNAKIDYPALEKLLNGTGNRF
jgi:olefin beta-lactone synthetase